MSLKLKSKLTGVIGELRYCAGEEDPIEVVVKDSGVFSYKTLGELLNDWTEFKVRTPLIEDEKARKAFREWADLFDAERFRVVHFQNSKGHTTRIESTDLTIEPSIELPGHIGEDSEIYSRSELIGEEEK